ncbi:hypothetical protein TWF679_009894 [Orbilia oligospora]|uniref:Uncharacterized protein n=1 Tax=Orbilia oligospora TaxID=2813651 RepID=A0A8H8V1U0_ORBOL|nr:hypothetical protein TWF679_009894 [Orbilia oligospora]
MALSKGYIDLVSTNATQDAPAAPAGTQPISVGSNPSTPTSPESGTIQDPKVAPDNVMDQHKPAQAGHLLLHIGGWANNSEIMADQLFTPTEPAT